MRVCLFYLHGGILQQHDPNEVLRSFAGVEEGWGRSLQVRQAVTRWTLRVTKTVNFKGDLVGSIAPRMCSHHTIS